MRQEGHVQPAPLQEEAHPLPPLVPGARLPREFVIGCEANPHSPALICRKHPAELGQGEVPPTLDKLSQIVSASYAANGRQQECRRAPPLRLHPPRRSRHPTLPTPSSTRMASGPVKACWSRRRVRVVNLARQPVNRLAVGEDLRVSVSWHRFWQPRPGARASSSSGGAAAGRATRRRRSRRPTRRPGR